MRLPKCRSQLRWVARAAAPIALPSARAGGPYPLDDTPRLNQIRATGTHNSYRSGLIPQGLPLSLGMPTFPIEQIAALLEHKHEPLIE